ncbi:MAG TPA: AMP-binding protein, partial [Williamwhitmania sp.]|nr:AMP-binding protein [Williamwhitmania sp.]
EKIFKNGIKPKLTDSRLKRTLYSTILGRKLMHRLAGKELKQKFGGRIRFFGVGGAKLDGKTEQFLKEAKFPYSIGYGMTEAAPLIAGSPPRETKLFSTGKVVQNQEIKISNPDPKTGIGEIWARGRNIMKGYYKLPELTNELISPDGWLKTGDLGKLQPNGYLYICGRLKNIILGSNGENIYPEDIEAILNRHQLVMDSLVYEMKGKLIAKVNLNQLELEHKYQEMKIAAANFQQEMERKIDEVLAELQAYVNNQVNRSSRLSVVVIQSEPFEKTPTQKIKRYLYI